MNDQPERRPTLSELAAAANPDPWGCPRCGCRHWRVKNSHETGGPRNRQRVCRNCNESIRTLELPVPEGYRLVIQPESNDIEDAA